MLGRRLFSSEICYEAFKAESYTYRHRVSSWWYNSTKKDKRLT